MINLFGLKIITKSDDHKIFTPEELREYVVSKQTELLKAVLYDVDVEYNTSQTRQKIGSTKPSGRMLGLNKAKTIIEETITQINE